METVYTLAGILPDKLVINEHEGIYGTTHWISLESGKVLGVKCNERQVALYKWEEQLSGSVKGKWTYLLIHNLQASLEKGPGFVDF